LPEARLNAALALHRRGRPEAVQAMIAEWHGRPTLPGPNTETLSAVVKFLAESANADAIAALAKDLDRRPIALRQAVHYACNGVLAFNREDADKLPKQVRLALERVLIGMLDDADPDYGLTCNQKSRQISAPRLCDVVASSFSSLAPSKYPFDGTASLFERDRAIVKIKNAWRKRQGLALLAVPSPRAIALVPEANVRAKVDRILAKPRPGDPLAAAWHCASQHLEKTVQIEDALVLEALTRRLPYAGVLTFALDFHAVQHQWRLREAEKLGPGALPSVMKLQAQTLDPAERALLDTLQRRLGLVITDTGFEAKSLRPDARLAVRVLAMQGNAIDADEFLKIVRFAMQHRTGDVRGLRFAVERASDGTGVTLRIDLLDAARVKQISLRNGPSLDFSVLLGMGPNGRKESTGWKYWQAVDVPKEQPGGSNSGCVSSTEVYVQDWPSPGEAPADLLEALREACATAPHMPIRIQLLLVAEKHVGK
jgi:hypothetical protein